jgi:hypothetical protein
MRGTLVVITLSFLVAVSGCVPNRAYRTGADKQRPRAPIQLASTGPNSGLSATNSPRRTCPQTRKAIQEPPETSAYTKDSEVSGAAYDLAFIEFDDMGEFWTIGNLCDSTLRENSQLAKAVALIKMRKENKTRPVFVITFIHGWKNNASEDNERRKNLAGFKEMLKILAKDTKRQYIGLFVAWRGQVIPGDVFTSYWNRRDAANRIAGPSMTEALFKLMFATRPESASDDPCAREDRTADRSHFVIVGHSFGGRILERAVAQPYMAMLVERATLQQAGCGTESATASSRAPGFSPPADLIVLLNPAADSLEGKAMIEGMMRLNVRTDSGGPLFLSISSQRDFATRKIMPMAQWVTLAGKSKTRKSYGPEAALRGQFYQRKQSYYFNNSEANVPEMRTHWISQTSSSPCSEKDGVADFTVGNKCYAMTPVDDQYARNKTPFWVISAPGSVIKNHWDIFEPSVTQLLTAIILRYGMGQTRIVIE